MLRSRLVVFRSFLPPARNDWKMNKLESLTEAHALGSHGVEDRHSSADLA